MTSYSHKTMKDERKVPLVFDKIVALLLCELVAIFKKKWKQMEDWLVPQLPNISPVPYLSSFRELTSHMFDID